MYIWSVTTRDSNGEIDQIEANTKAAALKKARSLYGNKGERDAFGRHTKQAVYVRKLYGGPSPRRNPRGKGTKAERAMASQRASRKRGLHQAVGTLMKKLNPGRKVDAVSITKLKGGGVSVKPVKVRVK